MPELHFKGKEYVYNHHLSVPYRPLIADPNKSVGSDSENLIIHGDNLHALKALMPRYAGAIDCIFIDPPYNTGTENWCYNDNVNGPLMREWLSDNPVSIDDMLRHDKWTSMMYPRLKLLYELLSEDGVFLACIDDNEVHRFRQLLDDIFGEDNFVECFIWKKSYGGGAKESHAVTVHEYVYFFAKNKDRLHDLWLPPDPGAEARYYKLKDEKYETRGPYRLKPLYATKSMDDRPNLNYSIPHPEYGEIWPETQWWWKKERTFEALKNNELDIVEKDGKVTVSYKQYLYDEDGSQRGAKPFSIIDGIYTQKGTTTLKEIFPEGVSIQFPKPVELVDHLLEVIEHEMGEMTILDSFAGSGTTAHAILKRNARDGHRRNFILVECEEYADDLTAERVRRVINGYKFEGKKKEELLRERITWSKFSKDNQRKKIMDQVTSLENLESGRFDEIKRTIKDGELVVTGEKTITDAVEGLDGDFTYYTLGDPLDIDKILTGEDLPDYQNLGTWVFHTATGEPLDRKGIVEEDYYLGESSSYHVWLIYKPDLEYLKSRDAALTLSFAQKISEIHKDKPNLVFAPAKYAPNKMLLPLGVEHAPLPFALYRMERS